MATQKQILKQFNVSASMAKRLAQLHAGIDPNYGTSMQALIRRGLVEEYEKEVTGKALRKSWTVTSCRLTDEGRKTIEGLRAAGW